MNINASQDSLIRTTSRFAHLYNVTAPSGRKPVYQAQEVSTTTLDPELQCLVTAIYPFYLVNYLNCHYFYDREYGAWTPLRSLLAHENLARRLADPFYVSEDDDADEDDLDTNQLQETFNQIDVDTHSLQHSYCINDARYKVWLEPHNTPEATLRSKMIAPLVPRSDEIPANQPAFTTFSVCPLASKVHWDLWRPGCFTKAEERLAQYFDSHSLELIRWFVGNGICDPIIRPRVLYIHAEREADKKAVTSVLLAMLKGTVYRGAIDTIGNDTHECIKSRFLYLGDVDFDNLDQAGCARVASLTRPTTQIIDHGIGQGSCSAIATGSKMWTKQLHLQQAWFLGRVITVTAKARNGGPSLSLSRTSSSTDTSSTITPARFSAPKWNQFDISKFANNCLVTRIGHGTEPPLNLEDAMRIVTGSSIDKVSKGRVRRNNRASEVECYEASAVLAEACGMSRSQLIAHLTCISKDKFIGEYLDSKTIRDISLQPVSPRSRPQALDEEAKLELEVVDYEAEYHATRDQITPATAAVVSTSDHNGDDEHDEEEEEQYE